MAASASSGVTEGAFNDARVKSRDGSIRVTQNPAMFIVFMVLAGGVGALLFFLGGSGSMDINGLPIPPEAAAVIGMVIGGALGLLGLVCLIQAFHPGTLILESGGRRYTRHGGIIGKLLRKGSRQGGFEDLEKVRVAHCRTTSQQGPSREYWRLTLYWKDGMEQNLGCYKTADQASAQAGGFAAALGVSVEATEGGS